ncbi:hypothetical protein F0562_017478 [Nyssa sinensis]|uniref:Uncharacterized protein n=1 Tax=Nyssa sinensis TaxID=561372 RepID=A0A5J4ZF75_9ASTE|nr:hypothetical protein F0562_017478 [Nyssa sinensis]
MLGKKQLEEWSAVQIAQQYSASTPPALCIEEQDQGFVCIDASKDSRCEPQISLAQEVKESCFNGGALRKSKGNVANEANSSRVVTVGITNESEEVHVVIQDEGSKENSGDSQNNQSPRCQIQRISPLLLRKKENKQCYYPQVASFGPYRHGEEKLKLVEEFKPMVKQWFASDSYMDDSNNKVFEVIKDARSCYVEGSTDAYSDEAFAEMMLLDGCLILCAIDAIVSAEASNMLYHFDLLTLNLLTLDMFLLENQIPFQVLEVLMSLKFGEEKGKEMINAFIVWASSGVISTFLNKQEISEAINEKQPPLHLLDALRTRKLSERDEDHHQHHTLRFPWDKWKKKFFQVIQPLNLTLTNLWDKSDKKSNIKLDEKKLFHSFRSATELKAKGIFVTPTNTDYLNDVKFKSYWFYGQLELPICFIGPDTKSEFLNFMAYELCIKDPNELKFSSYLALMKSLIDHPDDVKELRSKRILYTFGSDKEVVKLFKEIDVYYQNDIFRHLKVRDSIQKHYNSKARTWLAELYFTYFSSPWKTITLLDGIFLLALTVFQTYFSWEALQRM